MNLRKIAITLPAPICIVASISLFMTYLNHGMNDQFWLNWLTAFAFSLVVILPIAGLLIMKISVWVTKILPNINPLYQKLIQCVFIALCLESILAVISAYGTPEVTDIKSFAHVWALTLIRALPLGYVIAMTMVFIVKPRISRALAKA